MINHSRVIHIENYQPLTGAEAVERILKKAEQSRKLEQYPDLFNAFETNFTLKQVPASRNTAKS
jgi:hypothetical protein